MKVDKRKRYFLCVDVESTMEDHVADFGAALHDSKGRIVSTCGVVVSDFQNEELFHCKDGGFFSSERLKARKEEYLTMLKDGRRMMASIHAINKWLANCLRFNPTLYAYNLPFDTRICSNSGISLDLFEKSFCLWREANDTFTFTARYVQFALKHRYITEKLNVRSNAEAMAHYLAGNDLPEPHTALEDVMEYEIPIFLAWYKKRKGIVSNQPYNWRENSLIGMVVPAPGLSRDMVRKALEEKS